MRPHLTFLALALAFATPLAAQNDTTRPAPPRPDTLRAPRPDTTRAPRADTVSAPRIDTVRILRPPRLIPEGAGGQAPAQEPAPAPGGIESNLYLPIASWATPYVEYLVRAGVLQGLDPLERPFKRADVARAVAAVDTTTLAGPVRSAVRLLAWELEERQDTVRWKVEGDVAVQGASDPSRWVLLPQPQRSAVYYQGGLTGSVEFPHFALVTSPFFDTRLRKDAEFRGYKSRFIAGWNAEAYIRAEWKYFSIFFGSEPRNWGPPDVDGLLLSPDPYPYDHLMLTLGPRRFRLEMIATELNDLPSQQTGLPVSRLLSEHRLFIQPSDRFALALSEGVLYSDTAQSRTYAPWYLNAVNLWYLVNANALGGLTKNFLSLEASYLAGRSVRLAGQLFANDVKFDRKTATNPEKPEELGYTLSATGGMLGGLATWSALYTRVDNLVYQTQKGTQFQYSLWGVGIGRDRIDYDQSTLRVNALVAPRALLGGEITFIRQGEGNFATPFPPLDSLNGSFRFLTGVVERTLRLAVQANWTPAPGFNLSADVGRHFVRNANHISGVRGDRWVWRVKAEIRRRYSGGLHTRD